MPMRSSGSACSGSARRLRNLVLSVCVAAVALSIVLGAQVTVPFPNFVSGTVANPSQVNANFSALSNQSLNRTGGTMTGTLLTQGLMPALDATYALGDGTHHYTNGFFSGTVTVNDLGATGAVTGATVTAGTVTGGTVNGSTVTGTNASFSGTVAAGALTTSGSVTASSVNTGGVVTAGGFFSTGSLTAGAILSSSSLAGGTLAVTGASQLAGRVQIGSAGGLSPSFPAWRNTGAQMDAILGDASAYADIRGARLFAQIAGSTLTDVTVNGAATIGNRFQMAAPVTTYTAAAGQMVLANGTFTVTLPAATSGTVVDVKNVGSGTITVAPAAGVIDGAASFALSAQYQSITVVADGTNWWIR